MLPACCDAAARPLHNMCLFAWGRPAGCAPRLVCRDRVRGGRTCTCPPVDTQLAWRAGDFPDVNRYREILSAYDLSVFPKLKEKDVKTIEDVLSLDIPSLVKQFDNPYQ